MSWKGFQKATSRAPQNFRQKFNMGDITKDAFYIDAERRFQELETETNKLHTESKKYFDAIHAMLDHQIEFSRAINEIYKPISGRVSDPNSIMSEGNEAGMQACDEYEAIVQELKESISPELEMIDTRVVKPALEMLEMTKVMRKTATKRDHKQVDYDRTKNNLKKLQDKADKSLKDEKAMYKAENEFEQASQEYEYYNSLLKDELPKLFQLEREFIQPLFQSFYFMQLNVFYTLHERMQNIDIGYFNLQLDIEDAFEEKRGDIQGQTEQLSIVKFKTTGGRRPGQRPGQTRPAIEGGKRPLAIEGGPSHSPSPSGRASLANDATSPPPSYESHPNGYGAAAAAKSKPPPPLKPKPQLGGAAPAAETCTALYDYEAQAHGDLSFSSGDVITIVQRTQNQNEWWTGKVDGREGQFPGNYVQLN